MPWEEPFQQRWPDPEDDVRERFGLLSPSFSPGEIAAMAGLFLLVMGAVVLVLEIYV